MQTSLLHTVDNSFRAVERISCFNSKEEFTLVSFDAVSLFTKIPCDKAIKYIASMIRIRKVMMKGWSINIQQLKTLLKVCLNNTYFEQNGNFYRQKFGVAMGSPVSAVIANLYLDHIDKLVNRKHKKDILLYMRYVDDILAIVRKNKELAILESLNKFDSSIKFTMEEESNGAISFLDIAIKREGTLGLRTSVFRKANHSGQYLHFHSFGPTQWKAGVVGSLTRRAYLLCSNIGDHQVEMEKINRELESNGYPKWFIKKHSYNPKELKEESSQKMNKQRTKRSIHMEWNALGYKCKNILNKQNLGICFKKSATLANILRNPITKGKAEMGSPRGVVYQIPCKTGCLKKYIGETGREFNIRLEEHKKGVNRAKISSKLVEHALDSDHKPDWDKRKFLWRNIHNKGNRLFLEAWETAKIKPHALNNSIELPEVYQALLD